MTASCNHGLVVAVCTTELAISPGRQQGLEIVVGNDRAPLSIDHQRVLVSQLRPGVERRHVFPIVGDERAYGNVDELTAPHHGLAAAVAQRHDGPLRLSRPVGQQRRSGSEEICPIRRCEACGRAPDHESADNWVISSHEL